MTRRIPISRLAAACRRAVLLLLSALAAVGCKGPAESLPSVVVITIDTLRADHLSSYGYPRPTSPNLDRFMARGARVEWAFSASPSTAPSHASIFTGRAPSFHSVTLMNGNYRLEPAEVTLAELARDAEMQTAAVISNPVLSRGLGLDQGFEIYDDQMTSRELNREMPDQIAADAVDKALALLEGFGDRPFFLWLHLQDPHGPYTPPVEEQGWETPVQLPIDPVPSLEIGGDDIGFRRIPAYQALGEITDYRTYVDRYDAEIRYLDRQIERLLERLEQMGVIENGLVVLTSDHGEALGEEEFYFSHSHSVSLDQVRVPLAFVGAGIGEGQVFDGPLSHTDLFATVTDFLGLPSPPDVQSKSLLEMLRGGRPLEGEPVVTESLPQRGLALNGSYLRVPRFKGPLGTEPPEPGMTDWREISFEEGYSVYDAQGGSVSRQQMLETMKSYHRAAERALDQSEKSRQENTLSDEQRKRLKSLGYTR